MGYTVKHKYVETYQKEEALRERSLRPVRVDDKTIIMVKEGIADEEARENFYLKLERQRTRLENALNDRTRNAITKSIIWD